MSFSLNRMILLKFNNTHNYYLFRINKNVLWRIIMTKDQENQKSIIEQIYSELLLNLEENDDFSSFYVEKLRNLVSSGELSKEKPVYNILKQKEEIFNENS